MRRPRRRAAMVAAAIVLAAACSPPGSASGPSASGTTGEPGPHEVSTDPPAGDVSGPDDRADPGDPADADGDRDQDEPTQRDVRGSGAGPTRAGRVDTDDPVVVCDHLDALVVTYTEVLAAGEGGLAARVPPPRDLARAYGALAHATGSRDLAERAGYARSLLGELTRAGVRVDAPADLEQVAGAVRAAAGAGARTDLSVPEAGDDAAGHDAAGHGAAADDPAGHGVAGDLEDADLEVAVSSTWEALRRLSVPGFVAPLLSDGDRTALERLGCDLDDVPMDLLELVPGAATYDEEGTDLPDVASWLAPVLAENADRDVADHRCATLEDLGVSRAATPRPEVAAAPERDAPAVTCVTDAVEVTITAGDVTAALAVAGAAEEIVEADGLAVALARPEDGQPGRVAVVVDRRPVPVAIVTAAADETLAVSALASVVADLAADEGDIPAASDRPAFALPGWPRADEVPEIVHPGRARPGPDRTAGRATNAPTATRR